MKYNTPVPQPCNDCPFRRKSMPGWLGHGSPESFIDCINCDEYLPCHQTIDYTNPFWKESWVAQTLDGGNGCAGAFVMTANMIKRPRDPEFPRMEPDRETVFATPVEFVIHHRSLGSGSWNDEDQTDDAKAVREMMVTNQERCSHPEHRRGSNGRDRRGFETCMQCGAEVRKKRALPRRSKR